jgi:hypothetical protein
MYLMHSKKSRKTKRNRAQRYKAMLKAKNRRRRARVNQVGVR